ncbi:MAG: glycosyltransferase family 4 protein [candidate division KSB1 bacterium]|nr:glycosyltransferase family 4 protein [candidate division KSB1 bacterium]MDZ7385954.1 glycosyltransferase family 4 protein [candidate division KSB1 bacterium]MDZ7393922.1 glycosyltransferase family 4 protein [candidate division KSB1 bacterium]MDZ7413817.1 glycosyltransferase family 4 protein [candidate division KSB1 bacterium]
MRILYISQYFPPEVGATQNRAYEMATHLVRMGHEVTMLTEVPNHPKGIIHPDYRRKLLVRERVNGVDVVRVWVVTRPRKTFLTRLAFYLSFALMAAGVGVCLRRRYDVVFATSPPLFVGAAGLVIARARRARFVFEVRDVWPLSAVELGEIRNHAYARLAEKLEFALYRHALAIPVVTKGILETLRQRGVDERKLVLIPNGTNTQLFYDRGRHARADLGWGDEFVAMYAGIFGIAQGMEVLCEAARLLKHREDIRFAFVGEGPVKDQVRQLVAQWDLRQVQLVDEVSRERMPELLSAADACIVPLKKKPLFTGALPSKMFDAWACSRPVLLAVDGEARRVLEEAQGGLFVPPEDAQSLAEAILRLAADRDLARRLGANGRRYVEHHFSRQSQAQQLANLLEGIVS